MSFPIIPILTAIPSILAAYKTIKSLNNDTTHNEIQNHLVQTGKPSLTTKQINGLKKRDRNLLKRQTAIDLLIPLLLTRIQKRGGNKDDIGTLVDFACFVYKMARGK